MIEGIMEDHHIKQGKSTSYHPQENGKVEVINRALENNLTKVVSNRRIDCVDKLVEATWAYNTTWKMTIRFTPFDMIYSNKAMFSIEFT